MLLENSKLLYNVFVVDGLPYCDVCIKKMGMIRLGKNIVNSRFLIHNRIRESQFKNIYFESCKKRKYLKNQQVLNYQNKSFTRDDSETLYLNIRKRILNQKYDSPSDIMIELN